MAEDQKGFVHASVIKMTLDSGGSVKRCRVSVNGDLLFSHAAARELIVFEDCDFNGKVDFSYTQLHKLVQFHDCKFGGEVNFEFARSDSSVEFRGCEFRENARFNRMHVEGVTLFRASEKQNRTVFQKRATFNQAHFGREANFGSARFESQADFYNVTVEGPAFFRADKMKRKEGKIPEGPSVEFLRGVRFRDARFGELNCYALQCYGYADFSLVRVDGPAYFSEPDEWESVSYVGSAKIDPTGWRKVDPKERIPSHVWPQPHKDSKPYDGERKRDQIGGLDISGATFASWVRMDALVIDGMLDASSATFRAEWTLRRTPQIKNMKLGGCTYGRLELDILDCLLKDGFVEDERRMQVWLQLESVLRATGCEDDADRVYTHRRDLLHSELRTKRADAKFLSKKWRRAAGPWFWDRVVKSLGYGIDAGRIVQIPLAIWTLSLILFWWSPGAATFRPEGLKESTPLRCKIENFELVCRISDDPKEERLTFNQALGLTLNQISPLPLSVGSKFEPSDKRSWFCTSEQETVASPSPTTSALDRVRDLWCHHGPTYSAYGSFLHLLSWIVLPLWLARWAGLLNERARPKFPEGEGGGD